MSPIPAKRISVIMRCYNAARYVEDAVVCVMNQTYLDIQLIFVDDGSTDGSTEILASGQRATMWSRTRNGDVRGWK